MKYLKLCAIESSNLQTVDKHEEYASQCAGRNLGLDYSRNFTKGGFSYLSFPESFSGKWRGGILLHLQA